MLTMGFEWAAVIAVALVTAGFLLGMWARGGRAHAR
jgi:hypothetical protein